MAETQRMARVQEEFREILAQEILMLKDPRMGFVTVTGVKVTPDLRKAHVYYSVFGDEKAHAGTRAALRHATKHLRSVLGHSVRLKFTPELVFEEDHVIEHAARIDELLKKAQQESAALPEEVTEDDG
jgi:ribosome-binding factor A